MKKLLLQGITVLSGLISLLSLVGLYAVHYFTEHKMGMARHMIYLRSKWRGPQIGPLFLHQWKVLLGIMLLSLLFLYFMKRAFGEREKSGRLEKDSLEKDSLAKASLGKDSLEKQGLDNLYTKILLGYGFLSFCFSYGYFFLGMALKIREYELSLLLLLLQNAMLVLCTGAFLWRNIWLRKN